MSNVAAFNALVAVRGSDVIAHREFNSEESAVVLVCPCRTDEGYRDPRWHRAWSTDGSVTSAALDGTVVGTQFSAGQGITYRVYPDVLTDVPVGPPLEISQVIGATPKGIKLTWAAMAIDVGQVVIARQIDSGNWIMLGHVPTAVGSWIDDRAANLATVMLDVDTCNENAEVVSESTGKFDVTGKAFVQPVQSGATRRLTSDYIVQLFGEVRADDHVGIFPLKWGGVTFDFFSWDVTGKDYIQYLNRRFIIVNANLIPDPSDGMPHHWELGLRLASTAIIDDGILIWPEMGLFPEPGLFPAA